MAFAVSVVTALLWLGVPSTADAQDERVSAGVGVGVGSLGSSPNAAQSDRERTVIGYFNFGWSIDQHWSLGFDAGGTESVRAAGFARTVPYNISGTLTYYPRTSSGFFIKGGAGGSFLDMDIVDEFGTVARINLGTGLGLIAGTGWDVYLGRRFWLTPAVNVRYGRPGDLIFGRTNPSERLEVQRRRHHDRHKVRLDASNQSSTVQRASCQLHT